MCSPFTSTIRLPSTRVYSPRRPTLYQRPYELRVPTSCPQLQYNVLRAATLYYNDHRWTHIYVSRHIVSSCRSFAGLHDKRAGKSLKGGTKSLKEICPERCEIDRRKKGRRRDWATDPWSNIRIMRDWFLFLRAPSLPPFLRLYHDAHSCYTLFRLALGLLLYMPVLLLQPFFLEFDFC